jgi:RecB family exonuclease
MTAEQLGLEGMPRRLYACTPSRLTTWLDCPRRYRFTYLDRPTPPKGPPWAHNSLGASVHNALRAWWDVPLPRRTPEAAASLVESGWLDDGFRDDAQAAAVRGQAREMVYRYAEGLDPAVEPRAVERTVATKTERLALSGRVDRVDERAWEPVDDADDDPDADDGSADDSRGGAGDGRRWHGGELVVVDYKTGRSPLTTDDARGSLALAVYVLGVRRTLRAWCRRVELHHLPTGEVAAFDHTEESLSRHLRRAESIGAEASAADAAYRSGSASAHELDAMFTPRTGALCGWCDFQRICPEGLAAARPRRPWEAVEELALK